MVDARILEQIISPEIQRISRDYGLREDTVLHMALNYDAYITPARRNGNVKPTCKKDPLFWVEWLAENVSHLLELDSQLGGTERCNVASVTTRFNESWYEQRLRVNLRDRQDIVRLADLERPAVRRRWGVDMTLQDIQETTNLALATVAYIDSELSTIVKASWLEKRDRIWWVERVAEHVAELSEYYRFWEDNSPDNVAFNSNTLSSSPFFRDRFGSRTPSPATNLALCHKYYRDSTNSIIQVAGLEHTQIVDDWGPLQKARKKADEYASIDLRPETLAYVSKNLVDILDPEVRGSRTDKVWVRDIAVDVGKFCQIYDFWKQEGEGVKFGPGFGRVRFFFDNFGKAAENLDDRAARWFRHNIGTLVEIATIERPDLKMDWQTYRFRSTALSNSDALRIARENELKLATVRYLGNYYQQYIRPEKFQGKSGKTGPLYWTEWLARRVKEFLIYDQMLGTQRLYSVHHLSNGTFFEPVRANSSRLLHKLRHAMQNANLIAVAADVEREGVRYRWGADLTLEEIASETGLQLNTVETIKDRYQGLVKPNRLTGVHP